MSNLTLTEKYFFFKYLSQNKEIIQNIFYSINVKCAIVYDQENYNIKTSNLTQQQYSDVKLEIENLLDEISTESISIESKVVIHKTVFPNNTTLKDKVEKKFKVIVTNTAEEVSKGIPQGNQGTKNKVSVARAGEKIVNQKIIKEKNVAAPIKFTSSTNYQV